MKNQQRGIVWAPVLIMIGVLVASGTAVYFLIRANNAQNNNSNPAFVNSNIIDWDRCIYWSDGCNTCTGSFKNGPLCTEQYCGEIEKIYTCLKYADQSTNSNAGVNTNTASNINAVSNTNTTSDPTAGWKTYSNNEFGASFEFPTDWSITYDKVTTPGGDPANRVLGVTIQSSLGNTMNLTINPPGTDSPNPWKFFRVIKERGRLVLEREEVVDRSDEYADTEYYSIKVLGVEGTALQFSTKYTETNTVFDELAKQILSTFRFTN